MLTPVRTVDPSAGITLVTLAEAKRHCRVDAADEDLTIAALVNSAVAYLDGYSGILGRALLTQTWQQDFGAFDDVMRLPVGNLLGVTSVTYYDVNNAQQTLSASVYSALSDGLGPCIVRAYNKVWPDTYSRPDAVRVTWTAGYGAAAANVPPPIRQAVLLLVGHWYANREAVTTDTSSAELPLGVAALLAPYRRVAT